MKQDKFHHVPTEQENREQPRFNTETEAAMQETRDIISGEVPTKRYDSARALLSDLDND